jgi:hypothetical protein
VFVPPWLSITAEVVLDFSKSLRPTGKRPPILCSWLRLIAVTVLTDFSTEARNIKLHKATDDIAIVIYRQMMDPDVIGREASWHILIESFI